MSRVGKHPVQIPQGVNVEVAGRTVTAKGKLGTLKLVVGNEVEAAVKDGKVVVTPKSETPVARMQWGS
ncbi:MAG TPA: 50S ribosomal protein L6, partial [Stellaceae bacterium]|nr:50S ribosomal protein L6 [Stellaceae bacterium]